MGNSSGTCSGKAIKESSEADIIIIGGGLSGLAAGARCTALGMSVIIADKAEKAAVCDSRVAVLDSPLMRKHGITINKKQFARIDKVLQQPC